LAIDVQDVAVYQLILQARNDASAAFQQVQADMQAMVAELNEQTRLLTTQTALMTPRIATAHQTAVAQIRSSWASLSGSLGSIMNPLGFSKGMVFDLALGDSIKQAGDFEQHMLKIKALSEATPADIAQWGPALISMSTGTTVAAKDLADGLFFVASSGYHGAEALQVLNAVQMATAAGLGDMAQNANLVVSTMNAYGLKAGDAITVTDKLKKAIIEGHMEPGQLVPALGRTLPLAASAGIPIEEILAMISTQTRMGASPNVAATGIRTLITGLLKPTATARNTLEEIGFNPTNIASEIQGSGGLSGFLGEIFKRTGGDTRTLLNIFGSQRAATEALGLAKGGGETGAGPGAIFTHIEDEIRNNSSGTTLQAFQTTMTGFNAQLKELENTFQAMAITIGAQLLPGLTSAFRDFSQGLTSTITTVQTFFNGLGTLAGQIGLTIQPSLVLGSVLGVVLGSQLLSAANSVRMFIGNLLQLAAAMIRLAAISAAAAESTVAAWVAAAGPVLIVVGAIIAAAALIYVAWTQNWGGIQEFVGGVVDWMTEKISGFLDWMAEHNLGVSKDWRDQWSGIQQAVGGTADNVGKVKDNALDALGALKGQVSGAFAPNTTAPNMNDVLSGLGTSVPDTGALDEAAGAIPNLTDAKSAVQEAQAAANLAQQQFDLSQIGNEQALLELKRQQLLVDQQMIIPNQRIRDLQIELKDAANDQLRLKNEARLLDLDASTFDQNAQLRRVNLQMQQLQDQLGFTRSPAEAGQINASIESLKQQAFGLRQSMFGADTERLSTQIASDADKLSSDMQANRINQQIAATQASMRGLDRQSSAIQAATQTAQGASDLAKNQFDTSQLANKAALLGAQIAQATIQVTNNYQVDINNPTLATDQDTHDLVDQLKAGLHEAAAASPTQPAGAAYTPY
jgi:TP901 family phage tail tape measure protein